MAMCMLLTQAISRYRIYKSRSIYTSGEHLVLVLVHFSIRLVLRQIHLMAMCMLLTQAISDTEFTNLGVFVRQWGAFGTGPGAFQYPFGIATNPSNNHVYVADTYNQRIQEFTNLGVFVRQWGAFGYRSWCI